MTTGSLAHTVSAMRDRGGDSARTAVDSLTGEAQAGTTRVLLVEDNRMFAELLHAALEARDDLEIAGCATNGIEALSMFEAMAPDVVVLDYTLPGEDGVEVATQLGSIAPEVPLVMLTDHDDDTVLRAAISAGCTGFVTKSQAVVDLVRAIHSAREGVAALDAHRVARLALPAGRDVQRRPTTLTDRELEVLRMLAEGSSSRQIADRLFISVNTARNHVQRVIRKLDAHSRLEAVAIARRAGLLGEARS